MRLRRARVSLVTDVALEPPRAGTLSAPPFWCVPSGDAPDASAAADGYRRHHAVRLLVELRDHVVPMSVHTKHGHQIQTATPILRARPARPERPLELRAQ